MTYVVYADVLFLYHCLVNVTLLCMIQTILGQSIKSSAHVCGRFLWQLYRQVFF